jgi:hypothetical protein
MAAFTSTITSQTVFGNKRIVYGTYTSSAGATGGDVSTGLNQVEVFMLIPNAAAVATNASVVNETFPLASGDVTIVSDADQVGYWFAIGTF